MAKTTLTSKGQITLPKEVREHLGIDTGDRIEFVIDAQGRVEVRRPQRSVRELYGLLAKAENPVLTEELDDLLVETAALEDARIRRGGR